MKCKTIFGLMSNEVKGREFKTYTFVIFIRGHASAVEKDVIELQFA